MLADAIGGGIHSGIHQKAGIPASWVALKIATGSAVSSGIWEWNLCATASGSQARPKTGQKSFGIAGSDYQSGYRREIQSKQDTEGYR